ncbi:FecR family protein [Flagellimonas pacifica]|uniref:FecR family protein n=1 Tax=Flagellimonas pacifica TaxID=1247520 RepID=A0A285M4K6_9FLAO|nr:FecR domain-containing protein [Allomuricauda parva]SNY92070.1 FecR family protein [Allomuricauda parva]
MQNKEALIEKFLNRTISPIERKVLKNWVLKKKKNLDFFKEEIRRRSKNTLYHHFDESEAFKRFLGTIEQKQSKKWAPKNFLKYAAIFIGIVSVGFLIYQSQGYLGRPDSVAQNEKINENQQNNVVISLADGTKQVITTDGSNELVDKNGDTIAKRQAQGLDFSQLDNEQNQNLVFNEIYVPYGQTFNLTLSDGTKVWLNAGTRLKFPQNLNSTTQNRIVYLDGEAFFDVIKDEKRPFIVNAENLDIKVLGTQFNVSAYKSDGEIATTLVEGSVNVYENSNPDAKILLTPNHQASFIKENGSMSKKKVDTRLYTSWMENRLIIDNLTFEEVLIKLERTHNVSIINQVGKLKSEVYKGEFENEDIQNILQTIAVSTPFTYKIENNVITIIE